MFWPARALVLVAALSAVPLVSTGARAQDESSPLAAEGSVNLRIVGPDDPELRDSIRELLARLNLTIIDADSEAPDGGAPSSRIASVQIDLTSPTDALLVVLDGATGEARLRRSVPRDPSSAIAREEIAHAVQSAVEAALLAAGDRATAPPPAPPPPVPIVAPPPPRSVKEDPRSISPPSALGLELATLAGVSPIAGASGLGARVGLGATAISRAFLRPSLAISLLYAVPFDTGSEELSTHTSIASLRALPGVGLFRGSWLAIDLSAGGGFDVVTVVPRSGELPPSSLENQSTRVDGILSAMLTAHAAVTSGVELFLSAGIDVDLDSRQYVLAQGDSVTGVLAPWRVRPMLLAGFGFAALGDGHFPLHGQR